jgi:hypothetical protein
MSPTLSSVATLRSSLAHRRSVRRDQQRLERDLANYDTPSARLELDAILSRHTAEEIAPIEKILNRQAATYRPAGELR